jgi:Na+/H+-dicarboxylate symporter/ABC-type amino acid transport substrate-binding protein
MVKRPTLSFAVQIFASIIAGIICGLFFGERAQILAPLGDIFIKLIQVTIIPSIVIFIITGIGSINQADAKEFLKKVALIMLLIWFLGLLVFFLMQFVFPIVPSNSFFSTTQLSKPDKIDLINLFIPSNPFNSLSEGIIPAIVLFCLLLGFSLIGDEKNKPFVDLLKGLSSALSRITRMIIKTTPLGIFAITAKTAGTITLTQLLQTQVFFVSIVVLSCILVLLALPLLVYCLTPFGYREILSAANKGVLLGFSAADAFITLPLLSEGVASLFNKPQTEERARTYSGILVPLAYSFPSLGSFEVLLFILFTGWYYDNLLDLKDQLTLAVVGVPSLFGPAKLSLQFLLQVMQLPADAFQLYLISNPLYVYFVKALTCMSIFSFSTICTAFLSGCGALRLRRALISMILIVIILSSIILGLRLGFTSLLSDPPQGNESILSMKMPLDINGKRVDEGIGTKVYRSFSDVPYVRGELYDEKNGSLIENIKCRNILRVGYSPHTMPFAFFNEGQELVGYDIQMAYDLAKVLNVSRIEFVPVDSETWIDRVNNGSCDIIMSQLALFPGMIGERRCRFTSGYIDLNLALITKDNRKKDFERREDVAKMKGLKIAVPNVSNYLETTHALFPQATIIPLNNSDQFFNQTNTDVLLTTAETGMPLTLIHPFYDVAILQPYGIYKVMCAYAVSKNCDDASLMVFNYWLDLEDRYGSLDRKYSYWILGENAEDKPQRWSVVRDILHWIE